MDAPTALDRGRAAFAEHRFTDAVVGFDAADRAAPVSASDLEQLATAVAERSERSPGASGSSANDVSQSSSPRQEELDHALSQLAGRVEALQNTAFWTSDKAILILTGNRQIWLEATSNPSLTLRPPHGSAVGVDLVRGHFVTHRAPRGKTQAGRA